MAHLLEQEEYQNRTAAAHKAWDAAGHEGSMPCVWQELFECTLLDDYDLGRAINRKLDLLQMDIKEYDDKLLASKQAYYHLELDRMARRDNYRA